MTDGRYFTIFGSDIRGEVAMRVAATSRNPRELRLILIYPLLPFPPPIMKKFRALIHSATFIRSS